MLSIDGLALVESDGMIHSGDLGLEEQSLLFARSTAWLLCAGILALGALFRGVENALRYKNYPLRARLGYSSVVLALWAGIAVLCGELSGLAWIGLCLVGSAESVLAKGLEQGGSDPMTLWMRAFVAAAAFASASGQHLLNLLGVGLLLASYLCAGIGKAGTREWWQGRALLAYLSQPCYDLGKALLAWIPDFAYRWLGLAVLSFELLAPGVLFSRTWLCVWVVVGITFHLSNIVFFGLHRFFWTWIAAYPLLFSL